MNIDWSKAPEGFPLWLEGTNEEHRKHSGWYRRSGQVFEGAHGGQWRAVREGQFFTVHENSDSSPWTGEDLPPVGLPVEWQDGLDAAWQLVTVLAYHDDHAWMCLPGRAPFTVGNPANFRPIRTPEQIAAEERDNAVTEMQKAIAVAPVVKPHDSFLYALYDAGYRK
jgi:hypothetical protein